MGAQLTTKTIDWSNIDTETILITRVGLSPGFPPVSTTTIIYSGPGDFQDSSQSLMINPSGAVDSALATIIIDPDANGALPSVLPDDRVSVGGVVYGVIVSATQWNAVPKHLEIAVKRGPVSYEPSR